MSHTEFLTLIAQSNLIDVNILDRYLSERNANSPVGTATVESPADLAGALVSDGLLTRFQAEQLLKGKWRGFFIGRYKVLGMLGSGGMGKVFLCEHPGMRRQVAVKVLPAKQAGDAETVERFYREAQAIARLDHRNIVHAFDVAQDGEIHYLVMEYVKGSTLEDCVIKEGPLGPNRVIEYMRQAALGLQHAYEAGVVHRDIKPSNLLVTDTGVLKILDLGLARFFQEQDDELSSRFGGGVMGTIDYMAPEQAIDSTAVDIRADIYSLGATFYFSMIGRSPFDGATTTQKFLWHQVRDPEPLQKLRPELPPALTALITRMMAKDPANRFQTPDELLLALAAPVAETVEDVPRATVDTALDLVCEAPSVTRKKKPVKEEGPTRRFPKKLAIVVTMCLLSAAAGVYMSQRPKANPETESVVLPPKPVVAAKPATPQQGPPSRPLYLSDLPEEDVSVGRGQFGKGGSLGYDNRLITVRGTVMSQGLSMHPPANGSSHVRYEVRGNFRSLSGTVAINDTGVGKVAVGQVFVVKGDGRTLWESRPVWTKAHEQAFAIDLTGVHRLELEVRCPGKNDNAHAVWCDPKLLRTPIALSDVPIGRPIDHEGFIRTWLLLSPVPYPGGTDLAQAVDTSIIKDEANLEPKEGDKLKVGDKELKWEKVQADDYFFDLDPGNGAGNNCMAYAVSYIVAANDMKDVEMRIGSDDGAKVYVNGKEVGKATMSRGIGKDQTSFSGVNLKKGVNVVVFKVVNGHGEWKGALRFVDTAGNGLQGIKAQLTK